MASDQNNQSPSFWRRISEAIEAHPELLTGLIAPSIFGRFSQAPRTPEAEEIERDTRFAEHATRAAEHATRAARVLGVSGEELYAAISNANAFRVSSEELYQAIASVEPMRFNIPGPEEDPPKEEKPVIEELPPSRPTHRIRIRRAPQQNALSTTDFNAAYKESIREAYLRGRADAHFPKDISVYRNNVTFNYLFGIRPAELPHSPNVFRATVRTTWNGVQEVRSVETSILAAPGYSVSGAQVVNQMASVMQQMANYCHAPSFARALATFLVELEGYPIRFLLSEDPSSEPITPGFSRLVIPEVPVLVVAVTNALLKMIWYQQSETR